MLGDTIPQGCCLFPPWPSFGPFLEFFSRLWYVIKFFGFLLNQVKKNKENEEHLESEELVEFGP